MTIVEKINEENRKKYGEMQQCCNLYKYFCRCTEEHKNHLKNDTRKYSSKV